MQFDQRNRVSEVLLLDDINVNASALSNKKKIGLQTKQTSIYVSLAICSQQQQIYKE